MKEIRAFIQPHKLSHVTVALMEIPGFPGMTVIDCDGFGREHTEHAQDYKTFLPRNVLKFSPPTVWWKSFLKPSCMLLIAVSMATAKCMS